MAGRNWACSSCGRSVTLTSLDQDTGFLKAATYTGAAAGEGFHVGYEVLRCPNPDCQQTDLTVHVTRARAGNNDRGTWVSDDYTSPAGIGAFKFLPTSPAPLSAHAPASVTEDYNEAYLIRDLSPKASATLARRALQGMIRDFWGVSKPRLHDELVSIKDRCDADLYEALMAVKSVGNIGAHPERDVSAIVDIEEGEAQQLLDVLHLLDREWYIARAERQKRIASMTKLAQDKKGGAPAAGAAEA